MEANPPKVPPRPPSKEYIDIDTIHKCNLLSMNQVFCIRKDGVFIIDFKENYVKSVDYKYCPYCNKEFFRFLEVKQNV